MLARHLAIAGQYSGGLCGSSWGRVSIRLDRFPAYFVSPAVSYPFARFPPRRPVPPHPVPIQSRLASFRLIRQIPLIASLPSLSSPITPRLSCRVSGADFINASNSMPLKSGLWSGSFLAACLPSYGFPAALSAHLIISSRCASLSLLIAVPIPSRCRLTNGATAQIAPRQSPRPSCRRTGRRMCFDVIGCHAVDTVNM